MKQKKDGIYNKIIKRILDFFISLFSLIVLSPLLIILTIVGAFAMKGNPFFGQKRPGRIDKKTGEEKIFTLYKFRSMTNKKNSDGELLSDDNRLTKYGRILRGTSLDELPELWNILKGEMSFVGPRPLFMEYLPYYTEKERHRHDIRPGLTGWAQVNGRNNINTWEERFLYDLDYVDHCSFKFDIKILLTTVGKVLKKSDILVGKEISAGRLDNARKTSKQ